MTQKEKRGIFLAVMLAAVSVRITFTGGGSLLSLISEEYGLSSGTAGILTTLPLFAFGVCSMPVTSLIKFTKSKSSAPIEREDGALFNSSRGGERA